MPSWNPTLQALNNRLADLYFTTEDIRKILINSYIDPGDIKFTGASKPDWFSVLSHLNNTKEILPLLKTITGPNERGKNDEFLKGVLYNWENHLKPSQIDIPISKVNSDPNFHLYGNLELIMGQQSTLLPIGFLEKGLKSSKAVARIKLHDTLGTGFLIKENYIITNHHVIKDIGLAENAEVQFNFQTNMEGQLQIPEVWKFDIKSKFILDQKIDIAIIKLIGDANSKYGLLDIAKTNPCKDEFVNIIQHPMGGPKQIALYHNIVTYTDDCRLMYLTDTLPGSSGSPVFNYNWEVVAVHRKGGVIHQNEKSQTIVSNEGININCLREVIFSLKIEI
jgi:V8-like Glu-specific endopeptidase